MNSLTKIFALLGLTTLFTFSLLLGSVSVSAQNITIPGAPTNTTSRTITGDVGVSRSVDGGSLQTTILNIANIIIGLFAAVAVFYIIYGAFVWMNEGAQKGQEVVVRAVVGLLIAILAYIITQFALSAGGWLEGLFP